MFWAFLAAIAIPLLIVSLVFGGWVYLVLLIPALIAFLGFVVGGAVEGRSSRRRSDRPELLGPGGPDDPDRSSHPTA